MLVVLGLLVAVVLMHGVAADHEMAMAPGQTMMATPNSGAPTMASIGAHTVAAEPTPGVVASVASHPMIAMCVAILAGGLLLPLLAVARLKRRSRGLRLGSSAVGAWGPRPTTLRWLTAPSLTRLCVSRT